MFYVNLQSCWPVEALLTTRPFGRPDLPSPEAVVSGSWDYFLHPGACSMAGVSHLPPGWALGRLWDMMLRVLPWPAVLWAPWFLESLPGCCQCATQRGQGLRAISQLHSLSNFNTHTHAHAHAHTHTHTQPIAIFCKDLFV